MLRVLSTLSWVPPMLVISDHVVTLAPVRDDCMAPALPYGGVAVISRLFMHSWCRGDVVAVTPPSGATRLVTRRVLALPGDQIVPRGGAEHLLTVPMGYVWLEGDTPASTCEGLHAVSLLTGRVVASIPTNAPLDAPPCDRVYHRRYQ